MLIGNNYIPNYLNEIPDEYPYHVIVGYSMDNNMGIAYIIGTKTEGIFTSAANMGALTCDTAGYFKKSVYGNAYDIMNDIILKDDDVLFDDTLSESIMSSGSLSISIAYSNYNIIDSSTNEIYFPKSGLYNDIVLPELQEEIYTKGSYAFICKTGNICELLVSNEKIYVQTSDDGSSNWFIPSNTFRYILDENVWNAESISDADETVSLPEIRYIWANYDVEHRDKDENNTLRVIFQKELNTKRFNGVNLPEISQYIQEKYPYIAIFIYIDNIKEFIEDSRDSRTFLLVGSTLPILYKSGDRNSYSELSTDTCNFIFCKYNKYISTSWIAFDIVEGSNVSFELSNNNESTSYLWSNYDIKYIDSESIYAYNSIATGLPEYLRIPSVELKNIANMLRNYTMVESLSIINMQQIFDFCNFDLNDIYLSSKYAYSEIYYNSNTATEISGFNQFEKPAIIEAALPSVETINIEAFEGCANLTRVYAPVCTFIGVDAFDNCTSLESIYIETESVCELGGLAFTNTLIESGTGYIYVPSTLVDSYKSAEYWSTYANQIMAIEDTESTT